MKKAASVIATVFRWAVLGIFAFSSLQWGITPSNAAASQRIFMRVAVGALASLLQTGVKPLRLIDYGSYYWLELAQAEFLSLPEAQMGRVEIIPQGGDVAIMGYRFDPLVEGEPKPPESLRASEGESGFRLVQLAGPARDEWLQQISQLGAQILQYYPQNTYLVWATPGQVQKLSSLESVRWTGLVHPAYKRNNDLDNREGVIRNLAVYFYNDGAVEKTLALISGLGGRLLSSFPAQPDQVFYQAIFEMDASAIQSITRLPTVLWVGYSHPEPVLDDEMSSQIVAGNYTEGTPSPGYPDWLNSVGLSGNGVTWSIIDTGVDYDHPDLGAQISGGYDFPGACNYAGEPGSDCPNGGHGTHVAGIVGGSAASGLRDPSGYLYGLGIAPGHHIYALNSLSGSSWPPAGGWQEHSKISLLGGAIGGNNSWTTGEGIAHGYQASERTHDLIVLDGNFDTTGVAEPFIEVFSAGNSGPGSTTLTAPKEAKNLIVVGSSLNYRAGSIDQVSSFSSRGPTLDGRIAPTFTAPGEQIASTRNDDGGQCAIGIPDTSGLYAICSGTSMAAPHASGAVILLSEWWRNFNGGADPSPAMVKALLVNGAVDMGAADIPNNNEGWGRLQLPNVIDNGASMLYYDQDVLFQDSGETWSIKIGVADPAKPLKVTLAWSDAPGAVGANPALVNNLDLLVQANGSSYFGNHFSNGWSATGGSYDNLNNLENVYLQNPAGDLTISVRATQIAGDAVLYNGDPTDQNFALVCYNCVQRPDFSLGVLPNHQSVCSPQQAVYDVNVGQALGFDDPVTLSVEIIPDVPLSADLSPDLVVPPGFSQMTIGNTGAVSPGSYDLLIYGVTATRTHTTTVALDVFDIAPLSPVLLSPAEAASGVDLKPEFSWSVSNWASDYSLEVAIDPAFSGLVINATDLTSTSYTPTDELASSMRYYWRVKAVNACGESAYSPVYTFTTVNAPGDCPIGTMPQIYFADDLESGEASWAHSGTGDSWALTSTRSKSGAYAYHAEDPAFASDQRLSTPPIGLPASVPNLTLQFWNYQSLESRASGGCWDGGSLEISMDGGMNWAPIQSAELLSDPYDGALASSTNPVYPANVWCGDPQDWLKSVVQLDAYAGQQVQFRFRLGSDSSISREGWYIDDLQVQGCVPGSFMAALDPMTSTLFTLPGAPVIHTFSLTNSGINDVYELNLKTGVWPARLLTQSPMALPSGHTAQVQVLVEPPHFLPGQALSGSDTFELAVRSQYSDTLVVTSTGATQVHVHPGLVLSPPAVSGFAEPGDVVTHTFTLTNTGDYTDTIALLISNNSWSSTAPGSITLLPGKSGLVPVRVLIPLTLPEDVVISNDTFTLTASSGWEPKITTSAIGFTQASVELAVSLGPDQSGDGLLGTEVSYAFTLANTGDFTDTYSLEVSSGWASTLSAMTTGPISPGEQFTVLITTTVPADAPMYASDQAILTATSGFSRAIFDQASAVTTALWHKRYLPSVFR